MEDWGQLRRVIAVAKSAALDSGGELILTALEVWDGGIALNAVERLPEFLPPGKPIPEPLWTVSDDIGTAYAPLGGSASGSQSLRRSQWEFQPGPPADVQCLLIRGPGMRPDQEIKVDLG